MLEEIRSLAAQWTWELAAVILALWLGAWLALRLRRLADKLTRRFRVRHATRAERHAARLLEREGYRVLGEQVTQSWCLVYGEARHEILLKADYLVSKRGKTFVADVKTGQYASDPRSSAVRRQLLEYLCAFRADGALVVDMSERRLIELRFPQLSCD